MNPLKYFGYTQINFDLDKTLKFDLNKLKRELHKRYSDSSFKVIEYSKFMAILIYYRIVLKETKNEFEIFDVEKDGKEIKIVNYGGSVYFIYKENFPDMNFEFKELV